MDIHNVLSKVAGELRPATELPAVEEQLRILQETIQKVAKHAYIVPGGSYAKGTFIRGSHDIDCFVRFPKGTTDAQMATALQEAFPNADVLHGSRDYVQLEIGNYTFELVPVLAIDSYEQAENLMDMSPFHVQYVRDHLDDAQRDGARLAKQFTKAAGIYGAESFIRGFSGYVLELLISVYGSFEALLKAAAYEWKEQLVLDPEKHYESGEQALRWLNEAKTLSPIIIIDPVQKDRNAAAALSKQSFERFKQRARSFLENPSEQHFVIAISEQQIRDAYIGRHVFVVHARTPEGKRDIVGCKVLARHEETIKLLEENEFTVLVADWRFDEKESIAWYVLETATLPPQREQMGPPLAMEDATQAFREVHEEHEIIERDGRLIAIMPREYQHARTLIEQAWRELPHTLKES